MIFEEIKGRSLLVPDDQGGAPDNLLLVTLGVQLAKASVLAELHVGRHCQEENLRFLTKTKPQMKQTNLPLVTLGIHLAEDSVLAKLQVVRQSWLGKK